MTDWKAILLTITLTCLALRAGKFLILLIGRWTPEMHRVLINAMRRRMRDEEEQFAEKHGYPVDEHDDDPTDTGPDFDPEPWPREDNR